MQSTPKRVLFFMPKRYEQNIKDTCQQYKSTLYQMYNPHILGILLTEMLG